MKIHIQEQNGMPGKIKDNSPPPTMRNLLCFKKQKHMGKKIGAGV